MFLLELNDDNIKTQLENKMKIINKIVGPIKVNNEKNWTVQIWFIHGSCQTTKHKSKKEALSHIIEAIK